MKIYYNGKICCLTKKKIQKVFDEAIKETNFDCFCVGLSFVNSEQIKKLNCEYRKIDKVTDVLSFPNFDFKEKHYTAKELSSEIDMSNGFVNLGDIVICKKKAKEQAKEFSHSFNRELCFLALHGLLHLIGYDHMNEKDESKMNDKAQEILDKFKIKR